MGVRMNAAPDAQNTAKKPTSEYQTHCNLPPLETALIVPEEHMTYNLPQLTVIDQICPFCRSVISVAAVDLISACEEALNKNRRS
jgi:hypothetical protein